jgi:hypothetical protein
VHQGWPELKTPCGVRRHRASPDHVAQRRPDE